MPGSHGRHAAIAWDPPPRPHGAPAAARLAAAARRVPARPVLWAGIIAAAPLADGLQHARLLPRGGHWLAACAAALIGACLAGLCLLRLRGQRKWRDTRGRMGTPVTWRDATDVNRERLSACEERLAVIEHGLIAAFGAAGVHPPPVLRVVGRDEQASA